MTAVAKQPPINALAEETMLHIFTILANGEPYYRPTTVTPQSTAMQLCHVSSRWRQLGRMCRPLWNNIWLNLPGTDHLTPPSSAEQEGSRAGDDSDDDTLVDLEMPKIHTRVVEHSIQLFHHAVEAAGETIALHVPTNGLCMYSDSALERFTCEWIAANPKKIRLLGILGTGSSQFFLRTAAALNGHCLTSLRFLGLEFASNELALLAALQELSLLPQIIDSSSRLRGLMFAVHPINEDYRETALQLSLGAMPRFTGVQTSDAISTIFTNVRSLSLVNSPGLLASARSVHLARLNLTCSTSMLNNPDLLDDLANVIFSSRYTLRGLALHGWLQWNDKKLLNSIQQVTLLRKCLLDCYLTDAMLTVDKESDYTISYISSFNDCWSLVCQMPSLLYIQAFCTPITPSNSRDIDVAHIYAMLQETATRCNVVCPWSFACTKGLPWDIPDKDI